MSCKFNLVWVLTAVIADLIKLVHVQFAMPICPPMIPPPPAPVFPMPINVQGMCPMQGRMLAMTTTSTTKKPEMVAVAVPVPVPVPVPMPMPMPQFAPPPIPCQGPPPKPKTCPPCPPCVCNPSCSPDFYSYCSPCHMKCRCRNKETPQPLPNRPAQGPTYGMAVPMAPIIGPPPVVVVPYPPPMPIPQDRFRPKKGRNPKYSSSYEDSTESTSSSESSYKRRRKNRKRNRYGGYRRNLRSSDSENELVKPMLSYIAKNGDVKFKAKINEDEVALLLGESELLDKSYQTVHVTTGEDENNRPHVIVLSKNGGKRKRERHKKILLRGGVSNHVLENGRKELIFKPPGAKKISNLSVSFQIS